MPCARSGCAAPLGRNGVACSAHYRAHVTDRVPFLHRAFFTTRDQFTKRWLRDQVRHAVRGEEWTP